MSAPKLPTIGKAKIYDEAGKTCIPAEIRQEMGLMEGDRVVFVREDGVTKIYLEDETK